MKPAIKHGFEIGLIIILQIGLIVGAKRYQNMKSHTSPPDSMNTDKRITENDDINMNGKMSNVQGSYLVGIQPLDTQLRPYYQINIIVHVTNNRIYQQYVISPLHSNIPKNIQNRLQKSSMPRDINHYNVQAPRVSATSKRITFNHLVYDSKYSPRNEHLHFNDVNPFIIPPIVSGHHISVDASGQTIRSGGETFNKISDSSASNTLKKGGVNPQDAGY